MFAAGRETCWGSVKAAEGKKWIERTDCIHCALNSSILIKSVAEIIN
jgi:hypothetical protein